MLVSTYLVVSLVSKFGLTGVTGDHRFKSSLYNLNIYSHIDALVYLFPSLRSVMELQSECMKHNTYFQPKSNDLLEKSICLTNKNMNILYLLWCRN